MSLPLISPLRQQLADGATVTDLVSGCLKRIEQHNPALNAVVTLNPNALQHAAEADHMRQNGVDLPPLFGLPLTVKDVFATAGLRTTAGFPPLQNHIPTQDASVVARALAAGAILLGKTNLPELAGDIQCNNRLFGRTNNPFDLTRTSGGSSGGSAVAVAAGFSVIDIGSDLAGSIRIPAAFCGVVGLKATENRLPITGHIPPLPGQERSIWHMLSLGVLGRHVDDVRLGFTALVGTDCIDSTVPPLPVRPNHTQNSKIKIAYWDDFNGLPLCERTRAGLDQTVKKLQAAGFIVERAKPEDFDFQKVWATFGALIGTELGLGLPPLLRFGMRQISRFSSPRNALLHGVGRGLAFDMRHYNSALNQREQLIAALEHFLDHYDVWLCPVCPTTAFPHAPNRALILPPKISIGTQNLPYLEATMSLTVPFSLTGSPVISLPVGLQNGLPVGMQLVGKRWQEERLLTAAMQVEAVIQGYVEPPLSS